MTERAEPRVLWALAPDTGLVERDGLSYLAPLPDGPILVLEASASLILDCALDPVVEDTPAAVAAAYDVPVGQVRGAVEECLADLERRGLIRRASS